MLPLGLWVNASDLVSENLERAMEIDIALSSLDALRDISQERMLIERQSLSIESPASHASRNGYLG